MIDRCAPLAPPQLKKNPFPVDQREVGMCVRLAMFVLVIGSVGIAAPAPLAHAADLIPLRSKFVGENQSTQPGQDPVEYWNYVERQKAQVRFAGGQLLDAKGNPLSPGTASQFVLVQNRDRKVYAVLADGTAAHSTPVAGGRVRFAGIAQIQDGRLISIINWSGHYHPPVESLLDFLEELETRHGIDLSQVEIRAHENSWSRLTSRPVSARRRGQLQRYRLAGQWAEKAGYVSIEAALTCPAGTAFSPVRLLRGLFGGNR